MADNPVLSVGTADGATVSADDITVAGHSGAGVVQYMKLVDGTANGTQPVQIAGGTEANALRVTIANDSTGIVTVDDGGGTLTVDSGAAFTVQEDGAALTALQLIDDIVATDDTTTHATGTTKGVSIMAAATPTDGSVAANDIGSVAMSVDRRLHVDADITASVALDVSAATVTVDGSGVTQPVSAASLPLPTGAATNAAQLADGHNVTVDNGAVGAAVNIQDGGNSITVDGTVTANAGTGDFNVNLQDGAGTNLTSTLVGADQSLDINVTQSVALDVSAATVVVDATGQGDVPITLAGEAVVLGAGTAGIGKLTANTGVDIGDVDVTSISAGSNLIGDVGLSGARTSGGTTIFRSIDLDEGALEVIKASAGQIYWIHAINLAASVRFVKIYNATSGTIGTGTPVLTFPIPTQGDTNGAGFMFAVPNGVAFATGISIGASTGIADADVGAPGANEVVVNVGFA